MREFSGRFTALRDTRPRHKQKGDGRRIDSPTGWGNTLEKFIYMFI
jgi:hypothetical protein